MTNAPTPAPDPRSRLEALLARVREDSATAARDAQTVTLDQTAVGRLSRMDAMQQQAMAKSTLLRLAVQERAARAALDRLDAGTYGDCCACGSRVELDRLEADPAAPFCLACRIERDAPR